jgi:predicted Zn-dependent peptidase
MRDAKIFTLSNGMRVVHQFIPTTAIVHCGIVLDIGSRDENAANQGIAHFWEHMAFKGTKKRSAIDVITSLDSIGGELNAYTDKERIVFYASVRNAYFERAVDVLSDITFQSTFPEKELEKERGVILEEMAMYLDNPDDSLQDDFETVVYGKHPMGMNILGSQETVKGFNRKDFHQFFKEHVDMRRIVFSCVGNISLDVVEKMAHRYFGRLKAYRSRKKRKKFSNYKVGEKELQRTIKQAKCAIGRDAYPLQHPYRIPFYFIVNILGGPGMNSRLNLALRERYGFVYSIDAQYISYTDTGMFAVYFGTEPKQLDKCINLVQQELTRFCDKRLTPRQLSAAKEQIKGQMAMGEENNLSLMLMMGRSVLELDRVPTLEEVFAKIDDLEAKKILEVAQDMFDPKKLSKLTIVPVKAPLVNGYGHLEVKGVKQKA